MADIKQIGRALAGFGAGVQGRGAQFLQQLDNQRQQLDAERRRAMLEDAFNISQNLEAGNVQGAIGLLENRVAAIQQLGGNPADSMDALQKLRAGDHASVLLDMNKTLNFAQAMGEINLPEKAKPKYEIMDGQLVKIAPDGEVSVSKIEGLEMSPKTKLELEKQEAEIAKINALTDKAKAELAALSGKPKLTFSNKKELQSAITTMIKEPSQVRKAASRLVAIGKSKSPTDQLAAIFGFMKSLDPTSVVREGEQAQAVATGGMTDSMLGYINQLKGEGRLPDNVFDEMIATAQRLSNQAITDANRDVNEYLDTFGDVINEEFRTQTLERLPGLFEIKTVETGVTPPPVVSQQPVQTHQGQTVKQTPF